MVQRFDGSAFGKPKGFSSYTGVRYSSSPAGMSMLREMRTICLMALGGLGALVSPASALVVTESRDRAATFAGAACGTTDTVTVSVPRGARRVRAVRPRSGSTLLDVETGAPVARVLARKSRLDGRPVVRFEATGSDEVCANPAAYTEGWYAEESLTVRYRIRPRVYFRSYIQGSYLSPRYKPRQILFGERTEVVVSRWSSWDERVAPGRGLLIYNNCQPSCAEDPGTRYPITIRLSRVRACGRRYHYTRFSFRYPSAKPAGLPRSYTEHHRC
jgi:hypothetical protein